MQSAGSMNRCGAGPIPRGTALAGGSRAVPPPARLVATRAQGKQDPGTPGTPAWAHALAGIALAANFTFAAPDLAEAKPARILTMEEQATIELFKKGTPSVVNITTLEIRRDALTLDSMEIPQGQGSGIIWDKDGHIVTNYHVVKGANDVQVALAKGSQVTAKVIGFDQDRDVAVLLIDKASVKSGELAPTTVGTSEDLTVGQRVFAIGNPFGLDHTLTSGIISGTQREIRSGITGRPIQDVIQTDAAINPGNSGGPLLDSNGDLIGINTAIYSPSGGNTGVGFAIPVDAVASSVQQIITLGKVVRPIMGISFAPEAALDQLRTEGLLVLNTKPDGPAAKAGIQGTTRDDFGRIVLGDIIVGMNNKPVKNSSDLYRILDKLNVGDTVDLEVLRDRSTKTHVSITLEPSS